MDSVPLVAALLVGVVLAILAARSVSFVPRERRLIVERMGKFHRTRGPGWHGKIPLLEQGIVVDPGRYVRNWQGYGDARLEQELTKEFYARGAPEFAGRDR